MDECDSSLESCRNTTVALHLKIGAITSILVASALGVTLPLVGRKMKFLRTEGNFFFVAKAFAAGVILSTGFVHILADAQESLGSSCLPEHPWGKFPWAGFVAMLGALGTLILDYVGTEYFARKHRSPSAAKYGIDEPGGHSAVAITDGGPMLGGDFDGKAEKNGEPAKVGDQMHIVGIRAHAASHGHSHADGQHGMDQGPAHHLGHHHAREEGTFDEIHARHVVISQVLELGIIAHSVIIGISLGVSESPCTIRPLMTALVFHQFFEGFALGGCISQAGFKSLAAAVMALFFAITTPFGIAIGIAISSSYNPNSPHALIVEGLFDAISAGILIYMALVNLIAADFLSKRMRCDRQLQLFSYIALFAGAGAMSALAIWA